MGGYKLKRKVVIDFIHTDGSKKKFIGELNKLNGKWMWTWDDWRSCFSGTKRDITTFIKNIQKKSTVISLTVL